MALSLKNYTIKVVTSSGASLTSGRVLNALRERDEHQVALREQREMAQEQRDQRVAQRVLGQNEAQKRQEQRQQEALKKEENVLQKLRGPREARRKRLDETREHRRKS